MKGGKGTPRFRPGASRQGRGRRKNQFRYFTMYKRAIDWVARMQGLHDFDVTSIRHLPTTGLIHALWEAPFEDIAKDVSRRRKYLVHLSERDTVTREFTRRVTQPVYAKIDMGRVWSGGAL